MKYALVTILVPVSEGAPFVPPELFNGFPAPTRFTSHVFDENAEDGDYLKILTAVGHQAGLAQARTIVEKGWPAV